jgi:hypothetical protein
MALKQDIDYQISALNDLYADFVEYNDSVSFTDSDEKVYVTSETLLINAHKAIYTAVQEFEKEKRDSLVEYKYTPKSDTTLYNLCFLLYGVINEANLSQLIESNDLQGINRTDIDPLSPIIKKNTQILYYK